MAKQIPEVETAVDYFESKWPKGHKQRGDAMILLALAQIGGRAELNYINNHNGDKEKLETLKEISWIYENLSDNERERDFVKSYKRKLKTEARKWHNSFNYCNQIQVWEFIEKFFNLDEEDL